MRNTVVLFLLIGSLLLVGCSKELSQNDYLQANPPGNNGGSGNNGGTGSSAARNSYFPLTNGSWWKYKDSLTGTTSVGTATNATKSINNILYSAVVTTMGTQKDTAWTASPKPNYYMTSKGMSPSGGTYEILFHYLNDTASVGYNWQYTSGSGNGFTSYIKTTIVAKGLTMTVAGKTYTDVIQSQLDLSYDVMGTIMDFGNYNYFTAKGVGIIKIRTELSMMGVPMLSTCSDLIDYSIK